MTRHRRKAGSERRSSVYSVLGQLKENSEEERQTLSVQPSPNLYASPKLPNRPKIQPSVNKTPKWPSAAASRRASCYSVTSIPINDMVKLALASEKAEKKKTNLEKDAVALTLSKPKTKPKRKPCVKLDSILANGSLAEVVDKMDDFNHEGRKLKRQITEIETSAATLHQHQDRDQHDIESINPKKSVSISNPSIKVNERTDVHVFASNVTMHGIYHIFARHNVPIRRFLWSIVFVVAFTGFLYNVLNRVFLYRSYPHSTKIEETSTAKKTLDFPQVTFCNVNSFRWRSFTPEDLIYSNELTGLLNWNANKEMYELAAPSDWGRDDIHNLLFNQHMIVKDQLNLLLAAGDMLGLRFERNEFDMVDFTNRTGHQLYDLVKFCSYRGESCLKDKFFKTTFTRYGKCYTFNHGRDGQETLETLKGGKDNGLELILDAQSSEYLPVWKKTDENTVDLGFKVQIHAKDEPPLITELGFGISPGFQSLVSCKEQRISYLPAPYGDCIPTYDVNETLPGFETYFKIYSVSACRLACETRFIAETCGCIMVHMPPYKNYPDCRPIDYQKCADRALDWLVEKDQKTCICKPPCDIIRYGISTSMLGLPSSYGSSYYAKTFNVSESYVYDNFIKLNIFFEALNYEAIAQVPAYDFSSLLGDIGGNMGLFIGGSIMTIMEVFDYIFEVLKLKIYNFLSKFK